MTIYPRGVYNICEVKRLSGEKCERCKRTPRSEAGKKELYNRINRMKGQLEGIERMIEDDRYCADILLQVSALEGALRNFGYNILSEHMHSCVKDGIAEGNEEIIDETVEIIKKLR